MSNAIACFKWVIDEADLSVNPDLSVNYARARYTLSEYDTHAIEAAAQVAAKIGGEAVGVTFAPDVPKQLQKDALSRKLDRLTYVNEAAAPAADAVATAAALAAAIKAEPDCGIVICSEGAQDTFARQIPCRIAAALDLPLVTSVAQLEVEEGTLIAIRRLEDCQQTVRVPLPAVVAVLPEANEAPIPGMKAILAAGKKPVAVKSAAELGADITPKTCDATQQGYIAQRKKIMLEGSPAEMAAQLKEALFKEGVL